MSCPLFWDLSHFWNLQSRKSYNRGWKRRKSESWKRETGNKEGIQDNISLRMSLMSLHLLLLLSLTDEAIEIFDPLVTWGFFSFPLLAHYLTSTAWKACSAARKHICLLEIPDGKGCETLLSPQKDILFASMHVVLTYIRKLYLKTGSTESDVWSQPGGNEYIILSGQAREDDRGGMKVSHMRQDVTSTPQRLAKDRAKPCEYLVWLPSVSSMFSPICCPNVSSIWEKMLKLNATLEPI